MGLLDKLKPMFTLNDDTLQFQNSSDSDEKPARPSRVQLCSMISNLKRPLRLVDTSKDNQSWLFQLSFNAIAVECRDMFRIIEGLLYHVKESSIEMSHVSVFYDWFEGFFGILTCLFDMEENVLFPWIETAGFFKLENAFCAKRRQTKKERVKELSWDILELKIHFDMKTDRKTGLRELVYEIRDESEHLTARLMSYLQSTSEEIPNILDLKFSSDEKRHIEDTIIRSYRSSDAGHFVLCAMSRAIGDQEIRNAFLEENFRGSNQRGSKAGCPKQVLRFRKKHTDLADKIAVMALQIGDENSENK